MAHYECPRCGDYLCSPECSKAYAEERRTYWAGEYRKRQDALDRVRRFLDEYNMAVEDREALELVHTMAGRSADEAKRLSEKDY